jgi:hypothetical protein
MPWEAFIYEGVEKMKNTIGIKITGNEGIVYLKEFLNAGNDLLGLLDEIDMAISPNFSQTVDWKLKVLSYASPATLIAEPVVKEDQPDNRANIIETILSGLDTLKQTNDRPRGFTDKALEKARNLTNVVSDGVERIEVISDETSIEFSINMIEHINTILKPGRQIIGSVEGHIEVLNSHDGFKFTIYEPVLSRRIRCELMDEKNSQLRKSVYELYEHNVLASGILTTNAQGEVQTAKIDTIIDRDRKQVFKLASEIAGIYNVKANIDPVDYIRSLRDARN